jgi:AraC-like DNA-binding protein
MFQNGTVPASDSKLGSVNRVGRVVVQLREVSSPAVIRGGLAPWQVRRVTGYIEEHLASTIRLQDLAGIARLSHSHFCRAFKESIGHPAHAYVMRRRVQRAQGLMLTTAESLSQIAAQCGMADQAHFCKLFRRLVGESPNAWRRARRQMAPVPA